MRIEEGRPRIGRIFVVSFVAFATPTTKNGVDGWTVETPSGENIFVRKYAFEDVAREIEGTECRTILNYERRRRLDLEFTNPDGDDAFASVSGDFLKK